MLADGVRVATAKKDALEGTGRRVEVRVTGRERGEQDGGVDDRGQALNTGVLNGNDLQGEILWSAMACTVGEGRLTDPGRGVDA